MSRRIDADGDTLADALRDAVAQLADCDTDEVDLKLAAPGFDAEDTPRASLRVTIETAEPAPTPATRATTDEDDEDVGAEGDDGPGISIDELDEEADAAADFIEGLLDRMDLPGDLRIRITDDHAEVEVMEVGSGALIGRRGSTLESIQELVRCALQRQFERRSRVMIDVEGYRARRLEKYLDKAEEAIDRVLDTGEPERLEPMDVFERKRIHHLVAEVEGVTSRSHGREPGRRIVIEPSED